MIIKSYDFDLMDSKMYVIRDGDEAVVIDPNVNDEAFEYLSGVRKVIILLTHEHFDHISGVNTFKERYDCEVICSETCNSIMATKASNTRIFPFLFLSDKDKFHYVRTHYKLPYYCSADRTFSGELNITAAGHDFRLYEMPGHSPGSIVIMMDDNIMFSGDNILGNGNEFIFRDSDKLYYQTVFMPFIIGLKNTGVKVMPGHGTADSLEHFIDLISSYNYD